MRRAPFPLLVVLIATLVVAMAETQTPEVDPDVALLLRPLGFTQDDVRRVDGGGVVSTSMSTHDGREVATAGMVRVNVAPDQFVRRLTDIAGFKKAQAVLQIGTFSASPKVSDLAGLTLDSAETRTLRNCRIGNCGMQLPASIIERLRSVNWNDASAPQHATEIIRTDLVRYVQEYLMTGRQEDMVYVDQSHSVDVPAEFRDLVNSDRYVLPRFPDLHEYLLQPTLPSRRFSNVIYWSKEKVAGKAVISVTHLVIAPQPTTSAVAYIAGSKQLYGSHYFESSLGLTMVIRDTSHPTSSYVVYVNRSRVDAFGGLFGGITRRIVRSRARGALADFLEDLQRRLATDGNRTDIEFLRWVEPRFEPPWLNDCYRMTTAAPMAQKLPRTISAPPPRVAVGRS
jgi:hypothetical protein